MTGETKKHIYKTVFNTILILFFLVLLPITVSANSSWLWISEKRPVDILPFVILGTLLIEISAIIFIPKTKQRTKTILIVIAANIVSFLLPYFLLLINPEPYDPFDFDIFNRGDDFIVGFGFLFLTLVAEVPIVYFSLRKSVKNRKLLFFTVIGVNILTTVLVGIIERTLCYGKW